MNRLFLCLLIICPLLSFGQAPILTFDEFYQEGGIYPHRAFYDTTNLAQLNGVEIIWDFSDFDLFAPYGIYAIGQTVWAINAGETPDNDFKEEANFFLRTRAWSDTDEPNQYDYLKIMEDTVFQIGTSLEFLKREGQFGLRLDTFHNKNLQPIPVFFNNFKYRDIQQDSFVVNYELEQADSLVQVKSVFSTQYEGYGQIILNNGDTIQQVIKLKRTHNTTAIYRKAEGDSIVQRQHIHYAWHAKGYAGEVIAKDGNRVLLNYPFYIKAQPKLVNASVATCSETVDITLHKGQIINHCQITGAELSFEIDVFADGEIDSVGSLVENFFNYSFPVGNHTYTIIAKNECGSIIKQVQQIKVASKEAIEVICQKEKLIFLEQQSDNTFTANLQAATLDDGSFNSCNPNDSLLFRIYQPALVPNFHFNDNTTSTELLDQLPKNLVFDCRFLTRPTLVGLFAIHQSGSWEVCPVQVIIIDTTDNCLKDGQLTKICVAQPNGNPVSDVIISWAPDFTLKTASIAQKGCVFAKPDITQMMNLMKPDEFDLGVSSFDLLLIRQHILGINLFTKETQFLAADVNNSGTITTKDLLDLQKFILGKNNFFPGNSGWRFFPTYWLENSFDWTNLNIGHQLIFDPKGFEDRPYEFTAIKVGDVSSIPRN